MSLMTTRLKAQSTSLIILCEVSKYNLFVITFKTEIDLRKFEVYISDFH